MYITKRPKGETIECECYCWFRVQEKHDSVAGLDVKESHFAGKLKKYLDARLNVKIPFDTVKSQYLDIMVPYDFFGSITMITLDMLLEDH